MMSSMLVVFSDFEFHHLRVCINVCLSIKLFCHVTLLMSVNSVKGSIFIQFYLHSTKLFRLQDLC